jgi:hypothetical protein
VFGPVELIAEDLPPQELVSTMLPARAHASTAGKTRRAFLKLPANTNPARPNEKTQLAYMVRPAGPDELFAVAPAFVIFSVDVAGPAPGLIVAGENEHTRLAGR